MLTAEAISLNLGKFSLKEVSFNVKEGEYAVLLGPTGTGKTVLLETIAGHNTPRRGRILIKGRDIGHLPPEKRGLGVVYQDYALFPHLNVFSNIAFGLRLMGCTGHDLKSKVNDMAQFLDVRNILGRWPVHLSGGERQKVALARALVLNPNILLLDEPFSAIDRSSRDRLQRELKRIHIETGLTTLHITHDLSEAFFLGDRLIIIKDGAVLQEGSPENILARPINSFVARLVGIKNFIPCDIGAEGQILINGVACVAPNLHTDRNSAPGKNERIFLTVPDWAVEILPNHAENKYIWRGRFKIRSMASTGMNLDLELEHDSGMILYATLSRRELSNIGSPIETGSDVEVGISTEGVHWVEG
jgi:ABC-type Fe3+/spermidine/putrescine transport system ATPase subunit